MFCRKKLIKNKRKITGDVKELSTLVEHTFNQSAVLFLSKMVVKTYTKYISHHIASTAYHTYVCIQLYCHESLHIQVSYELN